MGAVGIAASGAKRRDPRPRHVDGAPRWTHVRNADLTRKYVMVNTGDPMLLEQYKWDGWSPVERAKDGPQLAGAATVKPGQEQVAMGQMLMSIPIERWEEIQREGPEGGRGSELADRREEEMLAAPGMHEHDPARGRGARQYTRRDGMQVVSESRYEGAEG